MAPRKRLPCDPVGAPGFTRLPTGYLSARLQREGFFEEPFHRKQRGTWKLNALLTANLYNEGREMFTSAGWDMDGIAAMVGLNLPPGLVLWRVSLDNLTGEWDRFHSWLSPDEQERARRFHFERDRDRFILRRGSLRWILARYLDMDPGAFVFGHGPAGKPVLAGENADRVRFNVSHSDDLAVVAVSAHHEVGVDVERVRPVPEADAILDRHFSRETVARWRGLPVEQQPEAFLRSWVRHEAEVKRSGQGLAGIREEHGADSAEGEVRWFVPASGYVGALAWVEGKRGESEQVGKWERGRGFPAKEAKGATEKMVSRGQGAGGR